MPTMGGLIEKWVNSVKIDETEKLLAETAEHPFGTPGEAVGTLSAKDEFQKRVLRAQPENAVIKLPGNDGIVMLSGFEHLVETIQMMMNDQHAINPLFRHARVEMTFRQNSITQIPARTVHTDPSRTLDPVQEDFIYFVSNKQGTMVQAQHIRDPFQTLNRMTPEGLVEEGLLKQAQPFEMTRGRQSTYHTQGARAYEGGRTFVRMIVTHPDISYFHKLPDGAKQQLPKDFREQNGITLSAPEPNF